MKSETNEQYLETLKAHVNRLKALLDDPQPGLFTWAEMYGREMQAISDMWNQDSAQPELLEACKKLVKHIELLKTGVVWSGLDDARAAIAKAEGK